MRKTITAKEAAEYLGVSYWLLLEKVKRGNLPCIRVGKRVLFRLESLDQWMDEQEKNSIKQLENEKVYGSLRKVEV